jgi:protein tyrosine/serine phosphatase
VGFSSLQNFRDVGGWPVADGRAVRTARFYRSDSLGKLDAGELTAFGALGIRTVIDLRRPNEVESGGRIADAVDRRYVNISPEHPLWNDSGYDESAGADRYLADRYLEFTETGRDGIGAVLAVIADGSGAPVLVHCFAGKDRTGVIVGLTLAMLGVADADIAEDYARSEEWTRLAAPDDLPEHWTVAPRTAITLFLADLRARYGTVERYAATAGLHDREIAALRAHLLA